MHARSLLQGRASVSSRPSSPKRCTGQADVAGPSLGRGRAPRAAYSTVFKTRRRDGSGQAVPVLTAAGVAQSRRELPARHREGRWVFAPGSRHGLYGEAAGWESAAGRYGAADSRHRGESEPALAHGEPGERSGWARHERGGGRSRGWLAGVGRPGRSRERDTESSEWVREVRRSIARRCPGFSSIRHVLRSWGPGRALWVSSCNPSGRALIGKGWLQAWARRSPSKGARTQFDPGN